MVRTQAEILEDLGLALENLRNAVSVKWVREALPPLTPDPEPLVAPGGHLVVEPERKSGPALAPLLMKLGSSKRFGEADSFALPIQDQGNAKQYGKRITRAGDYVLDLRSTSCYKSSC